LGYLDSGAEDLCEPVHRFSGLTRLRLGLGLAGSLGTGLPS
jgi:hypothetical protein